MVSIRRPSARLATRLAFVVAGFVSACWTPLTPFAKARLGVDDAQLGLLLLCFGAGSVLGVTGAGLAVARIGARPVVIGGGLGLCAALPALAAAGAAPFLAASLLWFGASLAALDVAMNTHGVEVEAAAGVPLMSGFHALFSLGGFAGAGWMTLALAHGLTPTAAALAAALAGVGMIAAAAPGLLAGRRAPGAVARLAWPSGAVLLMAGLAAIMFLAEGAVFDWSALLLVARGLADRSHAGAGFMLFSIAMTVGRLSGDAVVQRLGARRVLRWGGALAALGLAVILLSPWPLAGGGFLLVGLGAANVVPVLFSAAGRQTTVPPAHAVAAVTSAGYVGILAGPAAIGFAAQALGLPAAFWLLAGLVLLVPLLAGTATASERRH